MDLGASPLRLSSLGFVRRSLLLEWQGTLEQEQFRATWLTVLPPWVCHN